MVRAEQAEAQTRTQFETIPNTDKQTPTQREGSTHTPHLYLPVVDRTSPTSPPSSLVTLLCVLGDSEFSETIPVSRKAQRKTHSNRHNTHSLTHSKRNTDTHQQFRSAPHPSPPPMRSVLPLLLVVAVACCLLLVTPLGVSGQSMCAPPAALRAVILVQGSGRGGTFTSQDRNIQMAFANSIIGSVNNLNAPHTSSTTVSSYPGSTATTTTSAGTIPSINQDNHVAVLQYGSGTSSSSVSSISPFGAAPAWSSDPALQPNAVTTLGTPNLPEAVTLAKTWLVSTAHHTRTHTHTPVTHAMQHDPSLISLLFVPLVCVFLSGFSNDYRLSSRVSCKGCDRDQ